jgi:sugar lactone lactonase YvrE
MEETPLGKVSASGLSFPTSMAFSPDRSALYVTNFGFGFPAGPARL